jgi:hypothetical protein
MTDDEPSLLLPSTVVVVVPLLPVSFYVLLLSGGLMTGGKTKVSGFSHSSEASETLKGFGGESLTRSEQRVQEGS